MGLLGCYTTYQRLMNKVFTNQIGRNMEVYMDDVVTKTIGDGDHCKDLQAIFAQIQKFNMRLNMQKCAFGFLGEKFLDFLLTNRGIEANPEKCRAILKMRSLSTLKEVQQLTGSPSPSSWQDRSREHTPFSVFSKKKKKRFQVDAIM